MEKREQLITWCCALSGFAYIMFGMLLALVTAQWPVTVEHEEFCRPAHDRPLLETVSQVREARLDGFSIFHYDGVYYVIYNLPREYVDYSAWCARMP